jgi:hypothetical protein
MLFTLLFIATIHNVVHVPIHIVYHVQFCYIVCHHCVVIVMFIIMMFNYTIVVFIVITLDSLIISHGVIHSCHLCFVALFIVITFGFLTSFNIIILAFVIGFFGKRLLECCHDLLKHFLVTN